MIRAGLERRGFRIYDEFPVGHTYVGHYSSLLGLVPIVGGSLFVFELEGHSTPESVVKCATLVTNSIETLAEGIDLTYAKDKDKVDNAIHYFGGEYSQNIENSIISKHIIENNII